MTKFFETLTAAIFGYGVTYMLIQVAYAITMGKI